MPVGRVAVVALLLALASGETAYGQTVEQERESLRGIGTVRVVIQLNEDATGISLSEAGLEAAVELQLRRNGVPLTELPNAPSVRVSVLAHRGSRTVYSSVRVELSQHLLSTRGRLPAITWFRNSLVWGPSGSEGPDYIRDKISEYVDIFSNDYLTVNPQP